MGGIAAMVALLVPRAIGSEFSCGGAADCSDAAENVRRPGAGDVAGFHRKRAGCRCPAAEGSPSKILCGTAAGCSDASGVDLTQPTRDWRSSATFLWSRAGP